MKKRILWFFVILLLFSAVLPGKIFAFSDVPPNHPYFQSIQFLEASGIEQSEVFRPDEPMTRGEFIRWLLESDNFDEKSYKEKKQVPYIDIKIRNPYRGYIAYLIDAGFFKAEKRKKFLPKARIIFLDALRLAFFTKNIPAPLVFNKKDWPFANLDPDTRYAHIFYKAKKLSLLPKSRFHPIVTPTRAEAAKLIFQAHEISKNPGQLIITLESPDSPDKNHEITEQEKFPLLLNAWDRIHKKFLKRNDLDNKNLLYGAISGLVKELKDQHSEFARPAESTIQDTLGGQIEGIGAYIEADQERRIRIVAPIKSSPAETAGILPGDIVLEVNGEKVTGLTVTEAAAKIRGPAGTTVMLKIQRNGTTLDISIIRARVKVPTVIFEIQPDDIGVLTLTNFGNNVDDEFAKAVAEIKSKNVRALVLDLRNNPGGFLDAAITLGGYFIESGKPVAKVKYLDREEPQVSSGEASLKSMPLRILINKGSASASEILAGALQDYSIGKIIGEKSFGKGTVQELTTYSDGSSLKITVAEWLTPNGRTIEGTGITPDIEVKRTEEDIKAKRDPQLERALAELR